MPKSKNRKNHKQKAKSRITKGLQRRNESINKFKRIIEESKKKQNEQEEHGDNYEEE